MAQIAIYLLMVKKLKFKVNNSEIAATKHYV